MQLELLLRLSIEKFTPVSRWTKREQNRVCFQMPGSAFKCQDPHLNDSFNIKKPGSTFGNSYPFPNDRNHRLHVTGLKILKMCVKGDCSAHGMHSSTYFNIYQFNLLETCVVFPFSSWAITEKEFTIGIYLWFISQLNPYVYDKQQPDWLRASFDISVICRKICHACHPTVTHSFLHADEHTRLSTHLNWSNTACTTMSESESE